MRGPNPSQTPPSAIGFLRIYAPHAHNVNTKPTSRRAMNNVCPMREPSRRVAIQRYKILWIRHIVVRFRVDVGKQYKSETWRRIQNRVASTITRCGCLRKRLPRCCPLSGSARLMTAIRNPTQAPFLCCRGLQQRRAP